MNADFKAADLCRLNPRNQRAVQISENQREIQFNHFTPQMNADFEIADYRRINLRNTRPSTAAEKSQSPFTFLNMLFEMSSVLKLTNSPSFKPDSLR